jgi:microcystin-dependent protein
MSDQYLGEIRCFGFTFAPVGWAVCGGQILSIQQYTALFSLLGTYYGGNGSTNFGLPNLQGTAPMHWGNGSGLSPYSLGETVGTTNVTLNINEMPAHTHVVTATQAPIADRTATPNVNGTSYLGPGANPDTAWVKPPNTANASFSPNAISAVGGGQPHQNQQPYLVLNFCIALSGPFPPRG